MPTQALPDNIKEAVSNESYGSKIQPIPKWIQVDCMDGTRTLVTCYPFDAHIVNGMVLARVQLYGRIYHCRLQERLPTYRICDRNGKYIRELFPELTSAPKKKWDNEATYAAPYIWDEVND